MKNKKLLIISSMFILGSVLSVAGCGKEKQKASEVKPKTVTIAAPTAVPTAVPEPTATPVPAKILGTKTEGAYEVQLKNATTRPICAMAIKSDGEADFITQLMTEGDIFAPDEERMLYYKPAATGASYDIRITFGDDGSTVTLHAFPFGSMKKGDLLAADGVGYLNYEGIVDTKAAELAIVAQQVAEAQAAAARAAEAQAAAQSVEQYDSSESSYNENYDGDSSYDENSYDDNSYDSGVAE